MCVLHPIFSTNKIVSVAQLKSSFAPGTMVGARRGQERRMPGDSEAENKDIGKLELMVK